jgi:putative metallohydrolase (TIGR04338 family)
VKRPRDNQRQKLYNAENLVFNLGKDPRAGRHLQTIDEIQAYLDKLVDSAWFKRRWGAGVYSNRHGRSYRIGDGRGARRATGGMFTLTYPRWSRHEAIVLHELAHHIVERMHGSNREPWHGWVFASIFLELIEHQLGKETADQLKAAMRSKNVRFTKPRKRAPLSEERKAELREQLARARAARAA